MRLVPKKNLVWRVQQMASIMWFTEEGVLSEDVTGGLWRRVCILWLLTKRTGKRNESDLFLWSLRFFWGGEARTPAIFSWFSETHPYINAGMRFRKGLQFIGLIPRGAIRLRSRIQLDNVIDTLYDLSQRERNVESSFLIILAYGTFHLVQKDGLTYLWIVLS